MENNRLPPEQQVGGSNPSRRTIDSEGFKINRDFPKKYKLVQVTSATEHLRLSKPLLALLA